jgi:uncharacterized RDD family membrane protein YckC
MLPASPTDSIPHDDLGSTLITGEAVALDLRSTGFVLRAAGTAIDAILYLGGYVGLTAALYAVSGLFLFDDAISAAVSVTLLVICLIAAPTAVETISHGRSLGKLAVGARIVRDDGGAIGFRHAFIRSLTGLLEIYSTLGGIAAVTGLLNERSKRLGDFLAGTYSQHERVARVVPAVFGVPVVLADWARTADVARMPDSLSRRIAQFLQQAAKLSPVSRQRLSEQLAAEASIYVSPVPEVQPELFIAAVAAIRRDREFAALQGEQRRLDVLASALDGLPHHFPTRG